MGKDRHAGEVRVVTFVDDIEGTISKRRIFRPGILGDRELCRFAVRNFRVGSHYVDEKDRWEREG